MSLAENLRLEHQMSIIRDKDDQTIQMSVNSDGSINTSSVQKNTELTNISRNMIVPIASPYTSQNTRAYRHLSTNHLCLC